VVNGKKNKLILLITLTLVAAMLMSSCTTFESFKHSFLDENSGETDKTIYIGVFEPQSGKYAGEGRAVIKGIELANSIYNSVNGYRVELIKVDTKSSTSVAETAIQGLIEMKPVAIIGSEGEATSLVASKYIKKAMIPTITPSATNPLITSGNPYYFRACITESQMGAAIAEYAYKELGSSNIGVALITNDTSSTALMDGFNDRINSYVESRSDVVKMDASLGFTDEEMEDLLSDMRKRNIDTLVVPQGTEVIDKFFTMVEKKGMTNITFIGDNSWGGTDFVDMMEKHPDIKTAFPYDTVLDEHNENVTKEAEKFTILYHNKYGYDEDPNHYAALGYDSYLLVINAIYDSKKLDGKSVRNALADLTGIKGTTGTFSFDNNGNTIRDVTISKISGGRISTAYVTKEKTETTEISNIEGQ